MPSEKPFWIAPGNGKQQFPDRLVQAGYQLKNRIARFTAYLLRDPSRAPELTEDAIQDLVERKGSEAIQHHANVRGLLYGRVRAFLTANPSVDTSVHESIGHCWREKEMIQPHPFV